MWVKIKAGKQKGAILEKFFHTQKIAEEEMGRGTTRYKVSSFSVVALIGRGIFKEMIRGAKGLGQKNCDSLKSATVQNLSVIIKQNIRRGRG